MDASSLANNKNFVMSHCSFQAFPATELKPEKASMESNMQKAQDGGSGFGDMGCGFQRLQEGYRLADHIKGAASEIRDQVRVILYELSARSYELLSCLHLLIASKLFQHASQTHHQPLFQQPNLEKKKEKTNFLP